MPLQADYALLALFPDTVLFLYDSASGELRFSENIAAHYPAAAGLVARPFDEGYRPCLLHPEDLPALRALLRRAGAGAAPRAARLRLLDRYGEYRWNACHCAALPAEGGARPVAGKLTDIHEYLTAQEALRLQARTDPLTGMLNRAALCEAVAARLRRGCPGYLLMADLDDFKDVNDARGHEAGDRLLAAFAAELRAVFRAGDLVGRVGGDEFVVYMDGVSAREAVRRRASQLLARATHLTPGTGFSLSLGAAAFPADGCDYAALFHAADAAMYRAKHEGKSTLRFADEA